MFPSRRRGAIATGRLRLAVALVAVMPALLVADCGLNSPPQKVVVAAAGPRTVSAAVGGLGKVAAAVDVPVVVDYRGTVNSVAVSPGDHVKVGQPLLTLDASQLKSVSEQAAVRLQSANAALLRARALVEDAKVRNPSFVPGLQAQVQALQAQAALLQQLVDQAKTQSGQLTAPIEADVASVNARAGQVITPGKPLIELVESTTLVATASIPIRSRPTKLVGATAVLGFDSLPEVTLTGTVTSVSPVASPNGQTFTLTITAANTPDHAVLPGLQTYVRIATSQPAAVVIPKIAVLNSDRSPSVYVVDAGKVVHRRTVTLGVEDDTYVQILSGLSDGDVCVIQGNQQLTDGTTVTVSTSV